MELHCWGVRGSIAAPLSNSELLWKIENALSRAMDAGVTRKDEIPGFLEELPWYVTQTAGGDTSCYEVIAGDQTIILDAGTGLRRLGLDLLRRKGGQPMDVHILLSHSHWDHIAGFPFFVPAYIRGNNIHIYGVHPDLEYRFRTQQQPPFFPVALADMGANIIFHQLRPNTRFMIGDVEVVNKSQNHPGSSYGYRLNRQGKSIVYSTDSEYNDLSEDAVTPIIRFFQNADVVIFDAQYSFMENVEKEDWGHSNSFTGIDFAVEANVELLVLTHHEPAYDDKKLVEILDKSQEYCELSSEDGKLAVVLASEGLHLEL